MTGYYFVVYYTLIYYILHVQCAMTNEVNCFKPMTEIQGCQLNSKEKDDLKSKIFKSTDKAVKWILQVQSNEGRIDITSRVLIGLRLAGYLGDGGYCSSKLQEKITKLQSLSNDEAAVLQKDLPLLILGLKASCKDARNFKGINLIKILKLKLKAFPKEEFNHFYQFGLGIIALFVYDEPIPAKFGDKILRGVLVGKKRHAEHIQSDPSRMTDTQAISLIALTAIDEEKFLSHWVRKHIHREVRKGIKKIEKILMEQKKNEEPSNLMLLIQVLLASKINIAKQPYCQSTYDWILSKQKKDGSHGNVFKTSLLLATLSERSILHDLKHLKCPIEKDFSKEEVTKMKIVKDEAVNTKYVKNFVQHEDKKKIHTTVQVIFDIENHASETHEVKVQLNEGESALAAFNTASKSYPCFQYKVTDTVWGKYVNQICKTAENHVKRAYWIFYTNGKNSRVGIEQYQVKDGDTLSLKYMQL